MQKITAADAAFIGAPAHRKAKQLEFATLLLYLDCFEFSCAGPKEFMTKQLAKRDYSLTGIEGKAAIEKGLAAAEWYHTNIPRKQMKELMKRTDTHAIRDTAIWLGSLLAFAGIAAYLWPSWWSAPFWLAYGVLYGSAGDSRWHECGHGTAFKTQWMNEAVYQIASFMIFRNPTTWRWSHARHHTDTIIVGRDPEIAVMRPPALRRIILNFFGLVDTLHGIRRMLIHCTGRLHPEEAMYVPEEEAPKAILASRIWAAIYAATAIAAVSMNSILPFMLIGLPRLYGAWHHVMTGVLQHGGLADDVLDHRLNSRTVCMNPASRFIYWNMNYHVEHHMFPMVPYHALPRLHEMIKHDLPAADASIWSAYRDMWPVLKRQLKYEDVFLVRNLPPSANPYRAELHSLAQAA